MPKPLTLPSKLDRFPPVAIRLLARGRKGTRTHALTTAEISARSGLSVSEIAHLSRQTKWDEISVDTMLLFIKGCGADLDSRDWLRKNSAYMQDIRGIPRFLRRSPEWSSVFEPLIRIWTKGGAS